MVQVGMLAKGDQFNSQPLQETETGNYCFGTLKDQRADVKKIIIQNKTNMSTISMTVFT